MTTILSFHEIEIMGKKIETRFTSLQQPDWVK